jgi:hypothetical protein
MESPTPKHPQAYFNRSNPAVIVHLVGHAQFRLGEMKSPIVIYQRGDITYARLTSEFHTKFQQCQPSSKEQPSG